MLKPIILILSCTIPTEYKEQQVFYFDNDYSEVAREYIKNNLHQETFDPNDFHYKLLIKELEQQTIE